MRRGFHWAIGGRRTAPLGVLVAVAAGLYFAGGVKSPDEIATSPHTPRKSTGGPQLVSVAPLPGMEGPLCQWVPASANARLAAVLQQERGSQPSTGSAAGSPNSVVRDQAPVRELRDTYPTYSAVAVDLNSNEVYLQDENLFGYKVFNRLDNTPPSASFTEPKRMVGGMNTKLEFNCGLYIDPHNGDVYSVNNDMVDTLVVFPREANGNVSPQRELHTPHRTWGIAIDEQKQEMYLTVQHPPQVVVYPKTASGEDKPIRILTGTNTQLEDPHGIAIDVQKQLMFVANHGSVSHLKEWGLGKFESPSITVYPLQASGNVAPLRTIEGTNTRLNWPAALFLDAGREELYVANDADHSIAVFRTGDSGDVAPTRIIRGSQTGILNPTGVFVDGKNNEVWVSNMGNHSATVYPRTANGDVAPLRTIRSAPQGKLALAIGNPGGVIYDSKRDELLVPN